MKITCLAALLVLIAAVPGKQLPEFTDWSAPVNLGPVLNSVHLDSCVVISKDARSLFFSSNRQSPGTTNRDLYVSTRKSVEDSWGSPDALTMLNPSVWDSCPALSLDEHALYFTSARPGGCGGYDIWVSRRQDRRDNFGWEPPVNLGCTPTGPNSPGNEMAPTLFEDEDGRVRMYFASNRTKNLDHYQVVMNPDDTFGPATPLTEINSPYGDVGITVRRDGLEVFFLSNRPGGGGSGVQNLFDFWRSTRSSTAEPWSPPTFVASLGTAWALGKIALSFDGRELYFASYNQPTTGGEDLPDIWVARREKVGGPK